MTSMGMSLTGSRGPHVRLHSGTEVNIREMLLRSVITFSVFQFQVATVTDTLGHR